MSAFSPSAGIDRPPPDAPRPYQPTSYPVLIAAMLLVVGPLVIASQFTAHLRLDVVDDQMFGYYGWRIAHGAVVYRDVWDNKPPGIYWINALGFLLTGGESYGGVIALCAAALLVTHASFFLITLSVYYREAAAVVTVIASFFLTHGYYTCGTNRTETFLIALETSAVALYLRGFARPSWRRDILAGALCGGAFLFKQVGLAAWGAMGLHAIVLMLLGRQGVATTARRCFALLGGAAGVVALAAGALAWQGALGEALFATFTFNKAYFDVGESSFADKDASIQQLRYHLPVLTLPILMAIASVIHALLWLLRPMLRPRDVVEKLARDVKPTCPLPMLLFATWLAAAAYGAVLSPHSFRHYLVPTLPPLLLLSGYIINVILGEFGLLQRMQQRAWVTALFVCIGYFASEAAWRQWEEVSKVVVPRWILGERAEWEVLGEKVAAVTRPGDTIQCWGYQPGIYLFARRPNAVRFTTTEKIGQVKQKAAFVRDELVKGMMARPPAAFVIGAGDLAWLHGESPTGPTRVDELAPWLDRNYQQVDDYRNILVLKRRDVPPG